MSSGQACTLWDKVEPLVKYALEREAGRLQHYTKPADVYGRITNPVTGSQLIAVIGWGWIIAEKLPIPFTANYSLYIWILLANGRSAPRWVIRQVNAWLESFAVKVGCKRIHFLSEREGMKRWAAHLGFHRGATFWIKDL